MGMHTSIDVPLPKKLDVPQPDVNYINANPDLTGQLDVLKFEAIMILNEHQVKAKSTISGGVDKFTSGFDRLLADADCQDVIADNQSLYAENLEQGVYHVIQSGEETMSRNTFTSEDVIVKYPKPKVLISDKETIANIKAQEEEGLIFPWEKHIIMNPNLSEEQARKREEEINKIKEEEFDKEVERETKMVAVNGNQRFS